VINKDGAALPDPARLKTVGAKHCRALLQRSDRLLDARFRPGAAVRPLLRARARFMDRLLQRVWREYGAAERGPLGLVGVGGYGRAELHPHSDVDLLLLLGDEEGKKKYGERIERLIALLWESGIDVGHSVRTLQECRAIAESDLSVITNLMESRRIAGSAVLHRRMMQETRADLMWPSAEFFQAKLAERNERRRRYADAIYNLEPDVKNSPGGLRDLQLVGWITQRHFGARGLRALVEAGLLDDAELRLLQRGREFMQQLRYGLHILKKRGSDRLDFETQRQLAPRFGYRDRRGSLAVEQFMRDYYRRAAQLDELFEVLLQNFHEQVIWGCVPVRTRRLNARFRVCNRHIEVSRPDVFRKHPSALLEMFVLIANHPEIEGIRAGTLRLLRQHRELIDADFRRDPRNTRLFIELLRSPHKVARQLHRMSRCGLLGSYLPEFKRIAGLLQHDLFHIYTVDEHTIQIILNIRVFNQPEQRRRFPIAAAIVRRLPKIELLYIAALYHDIAKGRGGDHSRLGERDAIAFCRRHRLGEADTALVAWLVRHHLLMSMTAQRRDISDPEVIGEFARIVGDRQRLDYLYALTVADVCATNPALWNAWRDTLLRDLYILTRRFLLRGAEKFQLREEWAATSRQRALEVLRRQKIPGRRVKKLWDEIGEEYFLREKPADIAWHSAGILAHDNDNVPLVMVRSGGESDAARIIQIFVHAPEHERLFSIITGTLERAGLSVQDAHIFFSARGHSMHSFFVLEQEGDATAATPQRLEEIGRTLRKKLRTPPEAALPVRRITPTRLGKFRIQTTAVLETDASGKYSVLEVVTADRPGVLARIARVLEKFRLQLRSARINTLGERVDDVFYLTDRQRQPILDAVLRRKIEDAVCTQLHGKRRRAGQHGPGRRAAR